VSFIPNIFPIFKKITEDDCAIFKKITDLYPPYSDYNFTSMWCFNTNNEIEYSFLHDNLVVKFQDYTENKYFYSFFGTNKIEQTVNTLLVKAANENMLHALKLLPEDNFTSIYNSFPDFLILEDPDNFDYILSIWEIEKMAGSKYYDKRNLVNRFNRYLPQASFQELDLSDKLIQKRIIDLWKLWELTAQMTQYERENELKAFMGLLSSQMITTNSIRTFGIYNQERLIGFSINEIIDRQYILMHFEKADHLYPGIYSYLKKNVAQAFHKENYKFINYEQDLGIEGLRKAKRLWHPISYLKKYIISPK